MNVNDIGCNAVYGGAKLSDDACIQTASEKVQAIADFGSQSLGFAQRVRRPLTAENDFDPFGEQILRQGNDAGRAAAHPGTPAGNVDRAARTVIADAGYAKFFTHRTGHGLGIETHEEPYIRDGSVLPLEPGMTFTIEPGIYLPQRGGVRIEDDVLITEDGCLSLTDLPRELIRIA